MHERSPEQPRLSRRRLVGLALGVLTSALTKESATAPEPTSEVSVKERYISKTEIDELEANLYATADVYGLSLAPKEAMYAAFDDLEESRAGSEAISIVSAFTERYFSFPVIDTTEDGIDLNTGLKLQRLLSHLSLLPSELYEAINLEKIDIGVPPLNPPRGGAVVASFTTYGGDNTITFYPSYSDILHVTLHEISHGLDYVSRLGYGGEETRLAADEYLNEGRESEYVAEISTAWMKGEIQRDDLATPELKDLLNRYDTLVPGIIPYVEEALQPYVRAVVGSGEGRFFQVEE